MSFVLNILFRVRLMTTIVGSVPIVMFGFVIYVPEEEEKGKRKKKRRRNE